MANVTVPGACGYTSDTGVRYRGTREMERRILDEMHSSWRHMFDNWRDIGGHGSDAFPLREGYKTPK